MPPTEAQLRLLYALVQQNWQQSKLLYDFSPDPDSFKNGCYLAIFATPINHSEYDEDSINVYYIYANGDCLQN